MKNIFDLVKVIIISFFAFSLFSCNNSGKITSESGMRSVVVGTAATRTTIGYEGSDVSHLEWVDGDMVAYVSDMPGDLFKVATVNSNLFTAEVPASAENIFVVYPVGENDGKTLDMVKATLSSEIVQNQGESFNGELLPMYAYAPLSSSDRIDVVYQCVASVIRFTISGEDSQDQALQSVKLTASESLSGNYSLDLQQQTMVFEGVSNEISVTYTGEREDLLLSSSHDIYMVVPSALFTDVDVTVTTDADTYSWSDGTMDLTAVDRRLYRIELDLSKSSGNQNPETQVFKPVLSIDDVTDDGTYLIAVKLGNKYYVTNNVTTDMHNPYYVEGVEVASDEQGVLYSEDIMNYAWQITRTDGGYEFYSPNMMDEGTYGALLITQGGTGMFSGEDGYEGKVWFVNPDTMDGYAQGQQDRRYWDIEPDGQGKVVLRNKYDRGVGMFPCYKYCTFHDYFVLCFEGGGESKEDIMLLKL